MSSGIIILAGGKSSRMGQDKGLMLINEKPLIKHVIDECELFSKNIIIISNNEDYQQFGYPVYSDLIKDIGPIGGIYTGLTKSEHELNFVVSCDTPFINVKLIEKLNGLIDSNEIVIPSFNGRLNPLMGFYKKAILSAIKKQIEQKVYKVMLAIEDSKLLKVDVSDRNEKEFLNLNDKNDILKIENFR